MKKLRILLALLVLFLPVRAFAIIVACSSATSDHWVAWSIIYTGVHQTTPLGTGTTDFTDASIILDQTLAAGDDEILIDNINRRTDDTVGLVVGGGQTQRSNAEQGATMEGGGSTQLGSVAGDLMSWSWTDNEAADMVISVIKPSTASVIPTFLSVSPNHVGGPTTSISWDHAFSGGTNAAIFVGVSFDAQVTDVACTAGGVAMTKNIEKGNAHGAHTSIHVLANPAIDSQSGPTRRRGN